MFSLFIYMILCNKKLPYLVGILYKFGVSKKKKTLLVETEIFVGIKFCWYVNKTLKNSLMWISSLLKYNVILNTQPYIRFIGFTVYNSW